MGSWVGMGILLFTSVISLILTGSYRPTFLIMTPTLTQLQVKTSLNWLQVLKMAWKMLHSLFIKYLTEWDEIQNPHLPKIILFIRSISLILYPKIMLIVIKNLDELIVFNFSLVWIKPYTMKHLHRNTQCLFQEISN